MNLNTKPYMDIIIPLVAAFVGAIIGGLFALGAVILTHRHNLKLDEIQKQKSINGVLRAIFYELDTLGKFYSQQAGALIEKLKQDEHFNRYFLLREKYFIVYPQNTDIVGQIRDKDLVSAIVRTYSCANFLLEMYNINNEYLKKKGTAVYDDLIMLNKNRAEHTPLLKEMHNILKSETASLLKMIEQYLAEHPDIPKDKRTTTSQQKTPPDSI